MRGMAADVSPAARFGRSIIRGTAVSVRSAARRAMKVTTGPRTAGNVLDAVRSGQMPIRGVAADVRSAASLEHWMRTHGTATGAPSAVMFRRWCRN